MHCEAETDALGDGRLITWSGIDRLLLIGWWLVVHLSEYEGLSKPKIHVNIIRIMITFLCESAFSF